MSHSSICCDSNMSLADILFTMPTRSSAPIRHIVGCMTGTSLDGLDVALVQIRGSGLAMSASLIHHDSFSLGPLAATLRKFAEGIESSPLHYMTAARALGRLHAQAVEALCDAVDWCRLPVTSTTTNTKTTPQQRPDFIVAHGQTIWHAPVTTGEDAEFKESLSWQLFDPWPLVREVGVPVCYDLRQADLIAGGQGAPITPIADWVMYRDTSKIKTPQPRIIVNLGGICNITGITDDLSQTIGRDVCPCNIILDGVVQRLYPDLRFDLDGQIASSGKVIPMLQQAIVIDLWKQLDTKRSFGREQFPMAMLDDWVATARRHEKNEDILASYVAAVADLIVAGISKTVKTLGKAQVILAGGGAKNPALVRAINTNDQADFHCMATDDLGIPCEAREAMAFAVLGALSQDGVPIALPCVTGSQNPGNAGAWVYP